MKKLLSMVMSMLVMISASACSLMGVGGVFAGDYNYSEQTLKIKERDYFAPCYFNDFFSKNEHTQAYFDDVLTQLAYLAGGGLIVTIEGEEWSAFDRLKNKLPTGIYDIVIETNSLTMREMTDTGIIETEYDKKITIPVSVSEIFEDKYAHAE